MYSKEAFGTFVLTGSDHLEKGELSQDSATAVYRDGEFLLVVSDGAGSAKNGGLGARELVASAERAFAEFDNSLEMNSEGVRRFVERFVTQFRASCSERSSAIGEVLDDYHCTLVGAVGSADGNFCTFHVGDGAVVFVPDQEGSPGIISAPENGEYHNETFFVTQKDWERALRVKRYTSVHDGTILVMSDGLTPFAIGGNEAFSGFLCPLAKFLNDSDVSEVEVGLAATLSSEKAVAVSRDDKSLAWIRVEATDEGSPSI